MSDQGAEKKAEITWLGQARRPRADGAGTSPGEARIVVDPRWSPARVVCEWKNWDAMGEVFWLVTESPQERDAVLQAAVVDLARFGVFVDSPARAPGRDETVKAAPPLGCSAFVALGPSGANDPLRDLRAGFCATCGLHQCFHGPSA